MKKFLIKSFSVSFIVCLGFFLSSSLVLAEDTGWVNPVGYHDNNGVNDAISGFSQDDYSAFFDGPDLSVIYSFGEGNLLKSKSISKLVPEGAIIKGIEVRVDAMKNFPIDINSNTLEATNIIPNVDSISFDINLCIGSDNISDIMNLGVLPNENTDSYIVLGSPTSLWGYDLWDADIINSLGVKVRSTEGDIINLDSVSPELKDLGIGLFLDDIQVRITYSMPSYNINYNVNGGVNNPENPVTYDVIGDDIVLRAPTRTGYTFGGWYDNSELSGSAITIIPAESAMDYTLYAKWVAVSTLPQTGQYGILIIALSTIVISGAGMIILKKVKN